MNPTQRPVQRTNRLMMDVAKPPAAQAPPVVEQDIRPKVVDNIPVQRQAGSPGHDDDLDKIMKEVDKEMKTVDQKPEKHHLFQRGPRSRVKQSAMPKKASSKPAMSLAAAGQPAKKPSQNTTPMMIIVMTLIVTGLLAAAAVYAYK